MKKNDTSPAPPKRAMLTLTQMKQAIVKINRRIEDLVKFDINAITSGDDPTIIALSNSLKNLLVMIFGTDTVEYFTYVTDVTIIDKTSYNRFDVTPLGTIKNGVALGIRTSLAQLEAIKRSFEEEIEDLHTISLNKPNIALSNLELHPEIERTATKLFLDGHYSNAIEDSVKALNNLVRLRSGADDKDGTQLMEFVFNPKKPILKINDLKDTNDVDEQRGLMFLMSGAVVGLRNPRAHKIIKDDPEVAIEYIAFISLLAKLVDKCTS